MYCDASIYQIFWKHDIATVLMLIIWLHRACPISPQHGTITGSSNLYLNQENVNLFSLSTGSSSQGPEETTG